MTRRILLSFAHPDDESFGAGGLIARYTREGAEVHYLCATNGDVGTVSPEHMQGYSTIAELRQAELDCAAGVLDFKVIKLHYRDSGMMGSDTSKDPACLWQANDDALVRQVVNVIREVKPQVVITFNKYGGYGHPDHIKIQRATTEAFHRAGEAGYVTDGQAPYAPQKLYYTSIPSLFLRIGLWLMRVRGMDPRKAGRNHDIDLVEILNNVEPTHTRIDIRHYYDLWDKANACHHSQGGGRLFPLGRLRRWLAPYQGLTRVHPAPNGSEERDLFAGVQPDPSAGAS